ncbi:hypothetical protein LTR70_003272 [Exophiala xenobiotica]|uniref:Uncharacterized protein n=1 Tax=Lithohypha guttulata TaxID=1690604 RepID=A0ABR0KLJ8_9EURO|nr:hypothetical protein LTR24_001147 [Lithohypha guttulata]KAK5323594.1 hypothetical protein LTR70_003272 [Exophiala xenobiotica]
MPNKDWDCTPCKAAGANVTRGREGRGRHAQEIRTRDSRQSSYDSLTPGSPHLTISPWAVAADPLDLKEKKWHKPTRRQADDAWVIEHERRMSDLGEKTSQMSLSPHRGAPRRSKRTSPTSSYEHIIEADDVEEPEEFEPTPTKTNAIKMLPYELSDDSGKSSSHHRSRRTSYTAQHVIPHRREAPITPRRQNRMSPPVSERDAYETRQLVHVPRRRDTEPYRVYPQSCYLNSPASGSPIVGVRGQGHYEIVQHPLQHDAYYPRQYTVY